MARLKQSHPRLTQPGIRQRPHNADDGSSGFDSTNAGSRLSRRDGSPSLPVSPHAGDSSTNLVFLTARTPLFPRIPLGCSSPCAGHGPADREGMSNIVLFSHEASRPHHVVLLIGWRTRQSAVLWLIFIQMPAPQMTKNHKLIFRIDLTSEIPSSFFGPTARIFPVSRPKVSQTAK